MPPVKANVVTNGLTAHEKEKQAYGYNGNALSFDMELLERNTDIVVNCLAPMAMINKEHKAKLEIFYGPFDLYKNQANEKISPYFTGGATDRVTAELVAALEPGKLGYGGLPGKDSDMRFRFNGQQMNRYQWNGWGYSNELVSPQYYGDRNTQGAHFFDKPEKVLSVGSGYGGLDSNQSPYHGGRKCNAKDAYGAVRLCGLCEGDCNKDEDCQGNLVCFHRETTEAHRADRDEWKKHTPPGCPYGGSGDVADFDYCILPEFSVSS